jgi:hypothetical protein
MVGLLIAVPAIVVAGSWAITRPTGPVAVTSLFALLIVVYSTVGSLQKRFGSGYLSDRVFLKQVARMIPGGRTCYVAFDELQVLQTFHVLFHTPAETKLLHNLTYLRDSRIVEKDVYVVTRARDAAALTEYGRVEALLTSAHSPGERSAAERRTLFRIHLDDHLERQDASTVRVSPMQAIHRQRGPFLCSHPAPASFLPSIPLAPTLGSLSASLGSAF